MISVQSDIEGLLQITFDIDPEPKATAVLEAAQRMVEAEVGTPFDFASGLVTTLTGRNTSTLLLPRWPVTAVAVTQDGVDLVDGTDFVWNRAGYIEQYGAASGDVWRSAPNGIVVTYDAGWADETVAPAGLRQLVARIAARIWQTGVAFAENEGASGIVQETIGSYSVTYGDFSKDGSSTVMLDEDDRRMARRFRRSTAAGAWT